MKFRGPQAHPNTPGGLFECISMELSGSPEGYNAETGFCEPAQKPQSGEPNEHPSLYRIRRSQEKRQLLRQDCRRKDHRRGQTPGHAPSASGMGAEAHGILAWGNGSDAVQQLDLRRAEALCRRAADGQPLNDESHWRGQEEERPIGRTEDRRPGALQSASGLLCGSAGDARPATVAALPEPGGGTGRADEEPNERAADGSGRGIQQTAAARGKVFQRVAGAVGGSAGVGEGSAAAEPGCAGSVRDDAEAIARPITERADAGETSEAAEEHRRGGRGDSADLGVGGLRSVAVPLDRGCRKLLRADLGVGRFGRQTAAGADLQTAQRAFADGTDRGGETGAAVEPTVGGGARTGTEKGPPEPRDIGSGTEAGRLPVGGGQIGQTVRGSQAAGSENWGGNESGLNPSSELTSGKGDFPTRVARRQESNARTVLAVKGSLRRAKNGRALDCSGPFRREHPCDGRLRRENHPKPQLCVDTQRLVSDPPAVPRLSRTARRRSSLPMCQLACFEAGRLTQTQSSWTALCCSRKWMSGPADAWTQYKTDRKRSIVALTVGFIHALQLLPGSAGRGVFSLDKYLSWMSYLGVRLKAHACPIHVRCGAVALFRSGGSRCPGVAGCAHPSHLPGGAAESQSAFRPVRGGAIQLPVHIAREYYGPACGHRLARRVPGKRVPEVLRAAGYRRPPLHVYRQDQRAADVLRQPVDQEGADRLPRRVGGIRHRVQFPGVAQLGLDVSGGFRVGEERGRQRERVGEQHRPAVRDAVDGRATPGTGIGGIGRARDALQPERRSAQILLVEQRRSAGVGRLENLVSHALGGEPRFHGGGHVARQPGGSGRERDPQPDAGDGFGVRPRQQGTVHGHLPSEDADRGGALCRL